MRLLLVEDDELLIRAMSNHLTAQHYAVDVATDGETGWSFAQAMTYDLVVLDVNLPKLNGFQLCQRLRQSGYHQPILLLTAKGDSADKVTGLDAGADDYVVKPCTVEELSARIRALLRRQQILVLPVLAWNDLRLDPVSCQVTYAGQEVLLTAKEYSLLEVFLRHPQRVFSSSSILERLWAFEESPGEEAVRALMKRLRQKLRTAGAGDVIETLYGQGYRLKPPDHSPGDRPSSGSASESDLREAALEAWEQFQEPMLAQIAYLDQAVALLRSNSLSAMCRDEAEQAAHRLAGSLGMFGFPNGSQLAQEIERLLQTPDRLTELPRLSSLVDQLHQVLQAPPQGGGLLANPAQVLSLEVPAAPPEPPLGLLAIHEDASFLQQLRQAGRRCGVDVESATSVGTARAAIARQVPEAVLLSLPIVSATPAGLQWLEDLTAQFPTLPVLAIATSDDMSDRLEVLGRSRCQFVSGSVSPRHLLATVRDVVASHRLAGTRVMVVDDDPTMLTVLRQMLTRWEVHPYTLKQPEQFWETLSAIAPGLLILDVEMPQISGVQICQVVRSDRTWDRLPIIFLTGHQDMATIQQLLSVGADDCLTKPFTEAELISRLCYRLSRQRLSHSQSQPRFIDESELT
ncbi:MAG: response regulator [Cyanobacteria bacterium J069]|nr:MAG: response regulator [Cyanobacteria bacterium J069]